jgi:cytochrome c
MDFLDSLVLPQSSEHITLLHYMLMLVFFLFIPFISVLFGGVSLSLIYRFRGTKESNPLFTRFSRDLIETLTINKSIGIILGIVPVITAVLIFAQLLHTTGAGTVALLSFAFIFNTIGIILIYTYRYSFTMHSVFNSIKGYNPNEEVHHAIRKYYEGTNLLSNKSAIPGIIFLFIALWLFVTGITVALYPETWNDPLRIFYSLFSWKVLANFFQFLAASFAITGAAILFAFFYWEGGKAGLDDEYREFVRTTAIKVTFTAAVLQPLFLIVSVAALPVNALSTSMFGFAALSLFLLFLAYNYLYAMVKESSVKYSGHLFFVLLFAIIALVIKDQLAMSNSTKVQTAVLSANFDKYLADLKGTGTVVEVSGEEIFQVRCASCHKFDVKLVGPPYKETVPKYEGKVNDLVGFILNPVKVNPAYPPMPNPGLKPNEAKAVAEYILKTYKTK